MKNTTNLILMAVTLILAGLAWAKGGPGLALEGLLQGGRILWGVGLLLIAAFLVAGLAQVLVSEKMVRRWLGAGSGWRGIALACLGGALMPGGPYAYYPIAAVLLRAGASVGVLVAFIAAKNLWSVSRIPLEIALLGPHLTLVRFVVTLLIPPVMGIVTELLFGGLADTIRAGAPGPDA